MRWTGSDTASDSIRRRARGLEASRRSFPIETSGRARRSRRFRSRCTFSGEGLAPLSEHQGSPEQSGTIMSTLLMLFPDSLKKGRIENSVFRFHNRLVGHLFQFASKPHVERDGKPLFCTIQNVLRQDRFERL